MIGRWLLDTAFASGVNKMTLYEIAAERLNKIQETSFDLTGVRERLDLQRLLKN